MKKILLGMLILGAIASCKKDKKNCDLNSANIVGSYKTTAISYKQTATSVAIDEFAALPPCLKDDVITINSNGTTTTTDAGTACNPSSNDTGSWSLSGSQLTVDGDAVTVNSFDCNGMTVTFYDAQVAGDLTTVTLVKQ